MTTTKLVVCPTCGQTLLNSDAVERVRQNQASQQDEFERQLAAEASVLAEKLTAGKLAQREKDAAKAQEKRIKALEGALQQAQEDNLQLERRLQKLSSNERGELHEVDVYQQLLKAFPGDRIERRRKGGDIVHAIYYGAGRMQQRAGAIVYECKDTIEWDNRFIKQINRAGAAQRTPYLILVTRALPKGESTVSVKDGIIAVQPGHVVAIAQIVRRMVIEAHRAGLPTDQRDQKNRQLIEYVTSEHFRQNFGAVAGVSDTMTSLLVEEKRFHEKLWTRREQAYDDAARKSAAVGEAIRAIVEESSQTEAKVIPLPLARRAS